MLRIPTIPFPCSHGIQTGNLTDRLNSEEVSQELKLYPPFSLYSLFKKMNFLLFFNMGMVFLGCWVITTRAVWFSIPIGAPFSKYFFLHLITDWVKILNVRCKKKLSLTWHRPPVVRPGRIPCWFYISLVVVFLPCCNCSPFFVVCIWHMIYGGASNTINHYYTHMETGEYVLNPLDWWDLNFTKWEIENAVTSVHSNWLQLMVVAWLTVTSWYNNLKVKTNAG